MPKKHKGSKGEPTTGNQFIKLAEERGANVTQTDKNNFTVVKTPGGSVHIAAGDTKLDPQTRSNLKRWYKLLGLMLLLLPVLNRYLWNPV